MGGEKNLSWLPSQLHAFYGNGADVGAGFGGREGAPTYLGREASEISHHHLPSSPILIDASFRPCQ